jgi:hypothetical protein
MFKNSKQNQCKKIVPASGMIKNCQNIINDCPGKRDEMSYKHKRNSSRLSGCLAKQASPAFI